MRMESLGRALGLLLVLCLVAYSSAKAAKPYKPSIYKKTGMMESAMLETIDYCKKISKHQATDPDSLVALEHQCEILPLVGDIGMTPSMGRDILEQLEGKRPKRAALLNMDNSDSELWEMPIKVMFNDTYDTLGISKECIYDAMAELMDKTCVVFEEVPFTPFCPDNGACVRFEPDPEKIWSYMGQLSQPQPGEPQVVGINTNYVSMPGICTHELLHLLGAPHEQQRGDRNTYVTVDFKNIIEDRYIQYFSQNTIDIVPYDYSSVLHYFMFQYSLPPKGNKEAKPAMTAKDPAYNQAIYQRNQASYFDLMAVNLGYCPVCGDSINCNGKGYGDPKTACSECRCVDGWAGTNCEETATSTAGCGQSDITVSSTDWTTIEAPGYGGSEVYPDGKQCFYNLQADVDGTIEMEILAPFGMLCMSPSSLGGTGLNCIHSVEVKVDDAQFERGKRHCCKSASATTTYSATSSMMIIYDASFLRDNWKWTTDLKTDADLNKGFSFQYRKIAGDGGGGGGGGGGGSPCDSNPCQKGGTCTNDGDGFTCTCKGQATGPTCGDKG